MFSRVLSSALKRLAVDDPADSVLPTLSFPAPRPAGPGTQRLCARCLTLLLKVIMEFGDGTGCESLEMPHSSSMSRLSPSDGSGTPCVVCTKILLLFDGMRRHPSFEDSLRDSPFREWSLSWKFEPPGLASWHEYSAEAARVSLTARHKRGYNWGIGHFMLHPDPSASLPGVSERKLNECDLRVIQSLDGVTDANQPDNDFSSTFSSGSRSMITSWIKECSTNHEKCKQLFQEKDSSPSTRILGWFPDRLIRITTPNGSEASGNSARIVLKSDIVDFPPAMVEAGVKYLSFSHCWGPPPNPDAPLEGRADTVLTHKNLDPWRKDLPLNQLPQAFQDAVKVCKALDYDHIWIDSLCIIQNSPEDWEEQSAVMADVYKFAWLNITALSTKSDYEGFVNDHREPRVVFGFRARFASILGRHYEHTMNRRGRPCLLLKGEAKLLWDYQSDLPAFGSCMAPLLSRAWVYQETNLARRSLSFSTHSVSFGCDEGRHGEYANWPASGVGKSRTRQLLHSISDMTMELTQNAIARGSPSAAEISEVSLRLLRSFDSTWSTAVGAYTSCKLTKSTDRLMAISSIVRELANSKILQKRYLAGLWDAQIPFQLMWMTVGGRQTPWKARVGQKGYVAPSWSWASIEASVKPADMFWYGDRLRALVDVRAADVCLASKFAFGPVKAGWLRIWGRLRRVSAADYRSRSMSLIDAQTGEKLWFATDTMEGYEMLKSYNGSSKVLWVPLVLNLHGGMIEATALVLTEVSPAEGFGGDGSFVKSGEKVYRRLGTGDFGRIPSLMRQDKLLMSLGTYPECEDTEEMARGFQRDETGFQEFVLI